MTRLPPTRRFTARLPDLTIPVVAGLVVASHMALTWLRGGDVRWKTCVYAAAIVSAVLVAARLASHLFVRTPARRAADGAAASSSADDFLANRLRDASEAVSRRA